MFDLKIDSNATAEDSLGERDMTKDGCARQTAVGSFVATHGYARQRFEFGSIHSVKRSARIITNASRDSSEP